MFFCFIATLRIAGALEKSTEVMKSMQALVKMPEIQATMRDMSKEMMKVTTWSFFTWLFTEWILSHFSAINVTLKKTQ